VIAEEPVLCRRCRRELKHPFWRRIGFGRDCARREGITRVVTRRPAGVASVPVRPEPVDEDQLPLFELDGDER